MRERVDINLVHLLEESRERRSARCLLRLGNARLRLGKFLDSWSEINKFNLGNIAGGTWSGAEAVNSSGPT